MTDTKNGNGNAVSKRFFSWLSVIPFPVWGFLIVQFVAIAVWAIRLEGRVATVEGHILSIERDGTIKSNANEQRINAVADRMVAAERRQEDAQAWVRRLVAQETRVDNVDQRINSVVERIDRIVSVLDNMYSTQQEML